MSAEFDKDLEKELEEWLANDVSFKDGARWGYRYALQSGVVKELVEALKFYTNYDKESVRHMDTEFLQPQQMATVKPMNSIGKEYAPEDMHPNQIYQDNLFTYGPKQRPGKIARQALQAYEKELATRGDE